MSIVCIDTQIVIWGIRRTSTPGQEHRIPAAMELFRQLRKEDHTLAMTSITFAEACCLLPPSDLRFFKEECTKQFKIYPFDVKASLAYNEIFNEAKPEVHLWKKEGYSRINIITDMKIMATVKAHGAKLFYTDNMKDFGRLAKASGIQISCPPMPQLSLLHEGV